MRNEDDIKPNYARYRLLKEKPLTPFMEQMHIFWQCAGLKPPTHKVVILKKADSEKEPIY